MKLSLSRHQNIEPYQSDLGMGRFGLGGFPTNLVGEGGAGGGGGGCGQGVKWEDTSKKEGKEDILPEKEDKKRTSFL